MISITKKRYLAPDYLFFDLDPKIKIETLINDKTHNNKEPQTF